jgi:hypothetical protein
LSLIIDVVYGLYLKINIQILVILNKIITSIATSLTKAKIKLEIRAYNLRVRRSAIEEEMSEPKTKREIPKTFFRCPKCGVVTDNPTKYCPAGCDLSRLNWVELDITQIRILLGKGKIYSTRPDLFLPLMQNQNKKPPNS